MSVNRDDGWPAGVMAISLYTSSPKEEEEKEEKTFTNTKIASKETNGAWEDPRGPAQHLTQSFRIHFID